MRNPSSLLSLQCSTHDSTFGLPNSICLTHQLIQYEWSHHRSHSNYLEIPPKRYQSPADVNEIITRGPTQIYKSIPDQGLYKIKNFPQGDAYNPKVKEILDKIAQDAYGEIPTPGSIDYEEYLDSINYHMTITLQSRANVYVYISDDGMEPSIYDSLEYFSDGYKTEEEWGVEDWEQI